MPAKKRSKLKTKIVKLPEAQQTSSLNSESLSSTFKKKYISIALGLLVILGILFLLKSWFIVALVNNQPIWRYSVVVSLEKKGGKQELNSLITNQLILQEAKKKGVNVSDEELQKEIKNIEQKVSGSGQNLDQLLTMRGMTRADLTEQIRLEKLVEKLVDKKITITDKDVTDYIEKNKSAFPDGEPDTATKTQIKQQLTQDKLNTEYNTFLGNLQKSAKIQYFVNY